MNFPDLICLVAVGIRLQNPRFDLETVLNSLYSSGVRLNSRAGWIWSAEHKLEFGGAGLPEDIPVR